MIFTYRKGQLFQMVSLNKVSTVSMYTDSPLSVANIVEMAMFYLNWPVLMVFPYREGQLVQLLTVSMIQIVFYVLLT